MIHTQKRCVCNEEDFIFQSNTHKLSQQHHPCKHDGGRLVHDPAAVSPADVRVPVEAETVFREQLA